MEGKTYPAQMWLEYSSAELKAAAVTPHYIKIPTADKWLAGTDGDVYIELIGSDGQSTGKILLDEDGKNDFERNESFVYTLRNVKDVGAITKAILSLEDGDDWCVGSVFIDNGEVYTYIQWLEEGEQILAGESWIFEKRIGSWVTLEQEADARVEAAGYRLLTAGK